MRRFKLFGVTQWAKAELGRDLLLHVGRVEYGHGDAQGTLRLLRPQLQPGYVGHTVPVDDDKLFEPVLGQRTNDVKQKFLEYRGTDTDRSGESKVMWTPAYGQGRCAEDGRSPRSVLCQPGRDQGVCSQRGVPAMLLGAANR